MFSRRTRRKRRKVFCEICVQKIKTTNMKTIKILNYIFVAALGFFAVMFGLDRFGNDYANQPADTILYTEEYCQDIIGFNGVIPLEITMENGVIANINVLENKETPSFLKKVTNSGMIEKFYGLTPREAVNLDIDAVSGATFSSNAIIKSVKTRMAIYDKEVNPSPWTWQLIGIICCAVILCVLSICRKRLSH